MARTGRLPPPGSTRTVKPKPAARARKRPAVRKAAVSRAPNDSMSVGGSKASTSPKLVGLALKKLEGAISKLDVVDPGPLPASAALARLKSEKGTLGLH